MIYHLYSLLYGLAFLMLLPKEFLKRPRGRRLLWLKEKLGLVERPSFSEERPILWIHAVSVGETLAISPILKGLSEKYNLVLTTITDTGREVAEKKYASLPLKVYYLPLDLKGPLLRFLKRTQAQALLITETELWPNLLRVCSKAIPLALINGRLSLTSFKRYQHFKFFFTPLLNKLSFLAVQDEIYAERFRALRIKEEKLKVVGNLKFDIEIPIQAFEELENLPRPVLLGGSTHPGEEELILKAFLHTLTKGSLILVPRHPHRFKEVEKLILNQKREAAYFPFSSLKGKKITFSAERVIILFDEMGKLSSLYRLCDLAIIGGSFIPHGGQNPLEALYWKKLVIVGPHMENFPFVEEFLQKGALLQSDEAHLEKTLKSILEDPERASSLAEKAQALIKEKRGATQRTLTLISSLLRP